MTNLELVLNMLAEASTTEISKTRKPIGLENNKQVARSGGIAARKDRIEIEKQTGKSVISVKNAKLLRSKKMLKMKSDNLKFKIIEGKLTRSEAKVVQNEIRQASDITGYSMRELLRLKTVFKAFVSSDFAGACANFDFGRSWTELSAYIVFEKFRGKGIGKLLFKTAYKDAVARGKNIYIVSRNPAMIKIFKKENFKIITSFWQLPAAVILDTFIFAISWYRAKEFLRKLPMKKSGKFIFGVKLAA